MIEEPKHHKYHNHHKNNSRHSGYYGDLKSSQLHSRRKRSIGKAHSADHRLHRGNITALHITARPITASRRPRNNLYRRNELAAHETSHQFQMKLIVSGFYMAFSG